MVVMPADIHTGETALALALTPVALHAMLSAQALTSPPAPPKEPLQEPP
jgi:hypothetical protein